MNLSTLTWAAPPAAFLFLAVGLGLAAGILVRVIPPWLLSQWEAQWRDLAQSAQSEAQHPARGAFMRRARWRAWACVPLILVLAVLCHEKFGTDMARAAAALVFCAVLAALAVIDAESQLLPDVLVLPLLWAGLWLNGSGLFLPAPQAAQSAITGVICGYSIPWLWARLYALCTRREGMGAGDIKLTAALGAWLGVQAVFWVLFMAAAGFVVVGLAQLGCGRLRPGQARALGPYLAIAGVAALLSPFSLCAARQ